MWPLVILGIKLPCTAVQTGVYDITHTYVKSTPHEVILNILVIQCFRVVYHGISHESVVFSRNTYKPLGECVYQENTSEGVRGIRP